MPRPSGSCSRPDREKLAALGVEPMVMTSDEFTAHVGREIALNASLAEKAGLKAE
jgi:hypothetical protein